MRFLFTFLLFLGLSNGLKTQAQSDSLQAFHTMDSARIKDSVHSYLLAHIDTTFYRLSDHFSPAGFNYDRPVSPLQINIPQTHETTGFILFILTLLVGVLAIIKIRYNDYFRELFKSAFSFSGTTSFYRDFYNTRSLGSFLMNLVFVMSTSTFLYLTYDHWYHSSNDIMVYLYLLVFFSLHYLLRIFMLQFLGFLTARSDLFESYWFSISTINQLTALCVLPCLFVMITGGIAHSLNIIVFIFGLYLVAQFFKYLKGVSIGFQQIGSNLFQFIIYICTLEIAPVLVIYKVARLFL